MQMKRSVSPVPSNVKGMTVFNTDEVDDQSKLDNLLEELDNANEGECESCAI